MERVAELLQQPQEDIWQNRSFAALDGEAGTELEKLVPLPARRAVGAFFSGHKLAERLLQHVRFGKNTVVYDPACGAGDLLLAAARKLRKRRKNVDERRGGRRKILLGTDIIDQFLRVCTSRLLLQAQLINSTSKSRFNAEFCLALTNALAQPALFEKASNVVMNPPFTLMRAPVDCAWASGLVNGAALFVETALLNMRLGSRIHAILPEVLRTGSRYAKWRVLVGKLAKIVKIESEGLFPHGADVDVFILHLTVDRGSKERLRAWSKAQKTEIRSVILGDRFAVSVGPVVPHRDSHKGPLRRFAHARNIRPWRKNKVIKGQRRWKGRMEVPPFVTIRRTSRPGDKFRATASIVCGQGAVAVENHLIICRPTDDSMQSCEQLLRVLKTNDVNTFLNDEMRCRHLTVGVVRRIPLLSSYFVRD